LIVGTLLGDGCIAPHGRKNKSFRLLIGHSEQQKSLVLYKKAILGNLVNSINRREDKRGNSIMYTFSTVTHHELKRYYDLFYDNQRKVIKEELVHHLTPRALAFWIMDDGSSGFNHNRVCMRLHTEGFTLEDNVKLQNMLNINFNIRSKIGKFSRNNKEYCYLSINKKNTLKAAKLTEPYFVDSLRYKICLAPQRLECQSPSRDEDTV